MRKQNQVNIIHTQKTRGKGTVHPKMKICLLNLNPNYGSKSKKSFKNVFALLNIKDDILKNVRHQTVQGHF